MEIIRQNENLLHALSNDHVIKIFANENISLEKSAIEELETFSSIDGIQNIAITPDFHKGSGTPIGTVASIDRIYPNIVGNDQGCGMRFDVTGLNINDIEITDSFMDNVRHLFFEGGREVLVKNKADILEYGMLPDNLYGVTGEKIAKSQKAHRNGQMGYGGIHSIFQQYIDNKSERDNFLGSVGGGNHFCELQVVDEIVDRHLAYQYGLKVGDICIMSHSGSLDLGHLVSMFFKQKAKDMWTGEFPAAGYFYLDDEHSKQYLQATYNAANFAMVNRQVMSAMMAQALDTDITSIYDSPHNLVWDDGNNYLHRKGSCPAGLDEPVIIPGSMGTRSAICCGLGNTDTASSSPHGAGRILNRNGARKTSDIDQINIVTKIDYKKARPDVKQEVYKNLSEESPRVYKDITEVINTVVDSKIANVVAWMKPLMTVKG